jgi:hypothetical protein
MPAKKRKEPRVGSKFQRLFKHTLFTLEVVRHKGRVGYRLKETIYNSPSAAAKAVTNNSVNGWVFWGIEKYAP